MIKDMKNYVPDDIEFVLASKVKELFPATLFDGADSVEEIIEQVNKEFAATFPENEVSARKMDDYEKNSIREEYCHKQEDEEPVQKAALEEAIERAKTMKKNAEDKYNALLQEIRNLAAEVKKGERDYILSSTTTIKFALGGYWLFYSYVDGKMKLAKAEPIPEWDKKSLWSQEFKNREAMKKLFGLDFPETIAKPSSYKEEGEDIEEETENGEF